MAGTAKGTCPKCSRKGLMAPQFSKVDHRFYRQCLYCGERIESLPAGDPITP